MQGNDKNTKQEIVPLTVITCGHVDNGKSTGTAVMRFLFGMKSKKKQEDNAAIGDINHNSENPLDNFTPVGGTIADFMSKIDKNAEEKARGVTIDVTTVPLMVPMLSDYAAAASAGAAAAGAPQGKKISGLISLADCPGHQKYQKNTISGAKGANAAIIFVTVTDGVTAETESHITIAAFSQGAGLHLSKEENQKILKNFKVVVVINKIDLVSEPDKLREKIEDIEFAFNCYADDLGFHEKNVTFIRTSTLDMLNGIISGGEQNMQRLQEFYGTMRGFFQDLITTQYNITEEINTSGESRGTYMYLENVVNVSGIGEIAVGKVRGGILKTGDKLYMCGPSVKDSEVGPYPVVGIEAFYEAHEWVRPNSNIGVRLRGLPKQVIKKGFVLSMTPTGLVRSFKAKAILSDATTLRLLSADKAAFKRPAIRYPGFEPNGNDGFNTMPLKIVSFTHNGETKVFNRNAKKDKDYEIPLGVPIEITAVVLGEKLPIRNGSAMILREASMNVGQLSVVDTNTEIYDGLGEINAAGAAR